MLCLWGGAPFAAGASIQALLVASLLAVATATRRQLPHASRPGHNLSSGLLWLADSSAGDAGPRLHVDGESSLKCGRNPTVTSTSDKNARCPIKCPLHVENRANDAHCDFHCVQASVTTCKFFDPEATVPDYVMGVCRPCMVEGCQECLHTGLDVCRVCSPGHRLTSDGKCHNNWWWAWIVLLVLLGVLVLIVLVWVVDLAFRKNTNARGLTHALNTRSRAKLRRPKYGVNAADKTPENGSPSEDLENKSSRELWPLDTNLCKTLVAGPGLVLSFNFQAAVILWSVVIGLAWVLLGVCVDMDLFRMGTRVTESPREACIVVAWGYETQRRLLWSKVGFVAFCYVFTFVGALLHSVRQLRMFQRMDAVETTHKDFCAVLSGIPRIRGSDADLERKLKDAVSRATGEPVVAVSVAWLYQEVEGTIESAVEEHLVWLEMDADDSDYNQTVAVDPETRAIAERIDEETSEGDADTKSTPREDAPETSGRVQRARDAVKQKLSTAKERFEGTPYERWFQGLLKNVESVFLSRPMQKVLTRGRHHGFSNRHRMDNEDAMRKAAQSRRTGPTMKATKTMRERVEGGEGLTSLDLESSGQIEDTVTGSQSMAEPVTASEWFAYVTPTLEKLETAGTAYVTFVTEESKESAIEAAQRGNGINSDWFPDCTMTLRQCWIEPDGVTWSNFVKPRPFGNLRRFGFGFVCIALALATWCFVFYFPFLWISMNSSYTFFQEPAWYSSFTFSMLVVLGNVLMYTVCSEVTEQLRFKYHKDAEVCYMLLYTFSCVFNVIFDVVVTYWVAYLRLEGAGTRTYHGETMSEVPTVIRRIISYGMQRELGVNLKEYSFPGTFLIPFLIEPIMAVYLPWQLMTMLVRGQTNRVISIPCAEEYLASTPFDLSRYGDIHLNVILAVMIFFFPGGYTLIMFAGLALSHVWIYVYDHYRVLRFSPAFSYSVMDVDWWAQWMFCFPCAFLLSAFIFKLETETDFAICRRFFGTHMGDPDVSSVGVALLLGWVFIAHVVLHTLLLLKVVPCFGCRHLEPSKETYADCAGRLPSSFINTNPVQCLRSLVIHKDEPSVVFCMKGKEHLLQANPKAGEYFQDTEADVEDYSARWASPSALMNTIRQSPLFRSSNSGEVTPGLFSRSDGNLAATPTSDDMQSRQPRSLST